MGVITPFPLIPSWRVQGKIYQVEHLYLLKWFSDPVLSLSDFLNNKLIAHIVCFWGLMYNIKGSTY